MDRLTIITQVVRPAGALRAAVSVQAAHPHPWDIRHVLAYYPYPIEPVAQGAATAQHTDWLTGLIADVREGWIVILDDDNLLHPDLPRRVAELITPDMSAVIFDCVYPEVADGLLIAAPNRVKPTMIDIGQVALRADLAQSISYPSGDTPDGMYLSRLHQAQPDRFLFVNEPLTFHNAQDWQ